VYDPIRRSVIRQALYLSGFPAPKCIHRVAQQRFPSGAIVTAYHCSFSVTDIMLLTDLWADSLDEILALFVKSLNGAFCQDIFPTDWDTSHDRELLCVTICTRREATYARNSR
jgi:hypothetical protein